MKLFRLLALLTFCVSASFAQMTTTRISGYVKDPSDSVIPDAAVTVTNESTHATRQTTTNQDGLFLFNSLPPGTYSLNITASGFAAQDVKGITMQVGQEFNQTFKMALEGNQSVVSVEADAVALDTGR